MTPSRATPEPVSPLRRGAERWPLLSVIWRLVLVAIALLLVARLAWADVGGMVQQPLAPGNEPFALGVLLLVGCTTAALTLNYPRRANVSLLLLPVTVTWWHLGVPEAVLVGVVAVLFGNVIRGASLLAIAGAVARMTIAIVAGASVAAGLDEAAALALPALPVLPAESLATAGFMLVASAASALLEWLDDQLCLRPEPTTHTDLPTDLLLIPIAIFFQVVDAQLGFDRLAALLGGLLALLLVIRTSVNMRTLHRAVAEEREKLSTLVLHSGEGIFTVDGDLRIASVNPAMEKLLGQPAAAVEGQECAAACHFEDANGQRLCPDRCPLLQAHAEQRPISQEVIYRNLERPSEDPKHLLLTYAAVDDPGERLRLGIGIARDISALKEAEQLREDFVSLVTHELRTPLTVSTGYAGMLRRLLERSVGERTIDSAKALHYLSGIQGAEQHLLKLVNNLLEMARVERTELPVEYAEVTLASLLSETVETIASVAQAKGLRLELVVPDAFPTVWTSTLYLQEILSNLLSNAVKYTPEGGQITVTAAVRQPVTPATGAAAPVPGAAGAPNMWGAWWEIAVADTGYGISEEDQARLFTKFFRSGQQEVEQERGTGLGLALAKQMVERLGGTITVRSQLGVGSTFTIAFPLVRPEAAAPEDTPVPSAAASGVPQSGGA